MPLPILGIREWLDSWGPSGAGGGAVAGTSQGPLRLVRSLKRPPGTYQGQ